MKWTLALLLLLPTAAQAAETYTTTATTALLQNEDGTLTQSWSVSCDAIEPAEDALISAGGQDLRFVAAPDEAVAVGADDDVYELPDASSSYAYDAVPGAQVFARLTARCGSSKVFDEDVVDSLPIVTAPVLQPPFSVVRTDTLVAVDPGEIPAGVEVELVDVRVRASPRGAEEVVVTLRGPDELAPPLAVIPLGAQSIAGGEAVLSPTFSLDTPGDVVVEATFFDQQSEPFVLHVVPNDGEEPEPIDGPQSAGCATAGAAPSLLLLPLLLLRRRQKR